MVKNNKVSSKGTGLATTALVLGIIGLVFAFIPLVGMVVGIICGALSLLFGLIATVKKEGGKAIAGLVLGILAIAVAVLMSVAVYQAAEEVVDQAQQEQQQNTANWTQEIYDSIVVADSQLSDDFSTFIYTGGTLYSDIEAKVGAPTSTTSTDVSGQESITASWTTLDFSDDGKSISITLTYDKDSGQITAKNKVDF